MLSVLLLCKGQKGQRGTASVGKGGTRLTPHKMLPHAHLCYRAAIKRAVLRATEILAQHPVRVRDSVARVSSSSAALTRRAFKSVSSRLAARYTVFVHDSERMNRATVKRCLDTVASKDWLELAGD